MWIWFPVNFLQHILCLWEDQTRSLSLSLSLFVFLVLLATGYHTIDSHFFFFFSKDSSEEARKFVHKILENILEGRTSIWAPEEMRCVGLFADFCERLFACVCVVCMCLYVRERVEAPGWGPGKEWHLLVISNDGWWASVEELACSS